jgi:hypothetical protein
MKQGNEPFLYHAVISPYLNIGLLTPREVCERPEAAWSAARAAQRGRRLHPADPRLARICARPLLAEDAGVCRDQRARSAPPAARVLLDRRDGHELHGAEAIGDTKRHAYAHHIQRLMVTGNFALLAGIDPARSRNGICWSMPMPSSGWNCPTPTAWRCSPMAASWRRSPMRRRAPISTGCRTIAGLRLRSGREARPRGLPVQRTSTGIS